MTKKSLAKYISFCEEALNENGWDFDAEICIAILPYRQEEICRVCKNYAYLNNYVIVLKDYMRVTLSQISDAYKGKEWDSIQDVDIAYLLGSALDWVPSTHDQKLVDELFRCPEDSTNFMPFKVMNQYCVQESIGNWKQRPAFTGTYLECQKYYHTRRLWSEKTSWSIIPKSVCKVDYL